MSKIAIEISPVRLIDYTISEMYLREVNQGEKESSGESTIKIDVADVHAAGCLEEAELRLFELALTISTQPKDDGAAYDCGLTLIGIFTASKGLDKGDEDILSVLETKGVSELYDIGRIILSDLTSSGRYGSIMLPSIDVIGD